MKSVIVLLTTCTCLASCLPPPHPDVLAVRQEEELIVPPQLRSPALHNPHLREILPLTSLLHKGEKLVFEREANNVSRNEIYNILTHAGFITRHTNRPPKHQRANQNSSNQQYLYDSPSFPIHDYLQYLKK